jgi:hypothetical protein
MQQTGDICNERATDIEPVKLALQNMELIAEKLHTAKLDHSIRKSHRVERGLLNECSWLSLQIAVGSCELSNLHCCFLAQQYTNAFAGYCAAW